MRSEQLCCHTVGNTLKRMKTIMTIITYTIFMIDVGTIVNQQLSDLDVIFLTCYTQGRRIRLYLWNKGHAKAAMIS